MKRLPLLVLSGLLAAGMVQAGEEKIRKLERATREAVDAFVEEWVEESERPWRLTMLPSGELWGWQNSSKDSAATWDFGAKVYVEFARGRGHRIWWGGDYREAAGYDGDQTITPFDPRQIDTAQLLTWRWAPRWRRAVFVHMQRWCFHEIDVRWRSGTFFTHAALGLGTISPPEKGQALQHARRTMKPMINGYIYGGPFIYGGPLNVLGRWPSRNWEGRAWLSFTYPVKKWLLLEVYGRYDLLGLVPKIEPQHRQRAFSRFAIHFAGAHGTTSMFVGRTWHDDYLDRQLPVSWYGGLTYRF